VKSGIGVATAREALMSRYRRLKIEGGAFFYTPADRGGNATKLSRRFGK
jgi:hypothetical protein